MVTRSVMTSADLDMDTVTLSETVVFKVGATAQWDMSMFLVDVL